MERCSMEGLEPGLVARVVTSTSKAAIFELVKILFSTPMFRS